MLRRDNSARLPGASADVDGRTVQSAHLFSRGRAARKRCGGVSIAVSPQVRRASRCGRGSGRRHLLNNNNNALPRQLKQRHTALAAPRQGTPDKTCSENLYRPAFPFTAQAGSQWRVPACPPSAGNRPARGLQPGSRRSTVVSLLALRAIKKHARTRINTRSSRTCTPRAVCAGMHAWWRLHMCARARACSDTVRAALRLVALPRLRVAVVQLRPVRDCRRPNVAPRNVLMGETAR